jgi:hypothetical protein
MLYRVEGYKNDEYRATLSYELDVARRSQWLGRHGVSLLEPNGTSYETRDSMRVFTAHAEVPVYYTLRRPRRFVLSTTFGF